MTADRASGTARLIAAATVMREGSGQQYLAGPEGAADWCRIFLSTNRADRLLLWSACSSLGQAWWRLAEWATIPGLVSHWMRRKREIDRLARQAAVDGFEQLVVLGAGLDSLAFRVDEQRVFGRIVLADRPTTLAVVRTATGASDATTLNSTGAAKTHGVGFLALDLARDDVSTLLAASREFDSNRATLVVIEGVLMYLSATNVERVLQSLASLPAPRARLIVSSMIQDERRPVGFQGQSRLVNYWLSRRQETMRWASSRSALLALLNECGWTAVRLVDLVGEEAGCGTTSSGLGSEVLAVAERAGRMRGQ